MRFNFIKLYEDFTKNQNSPEKQDTKDITPLDVYNKLVSNKKIPPNSTILILIGSQQKCYLVVDGKIKENFPVSTSAKGFGQSPESGMTPWGLFKTGKSIVGKKYEILVAKKPTGKILGPDISSSRKDEKGKVHTAEVLTALIELHGQEDKNKSAFSRSIYIHGTNRESNLGKAASGGCVRVANDKILDLVKILPDESFLYILPPNTPVS